MMVDGAATVTFAVLGGLVLAHGTVDTGTVDDPSVHRDAKLMRVAIGMWAVAAVYAASTVYGYSITSACEAQQSALDAKVGAAAHESALDGARVPPQPPPVIDGGIAPSDALPDAS